MARKARGAPADGARNRRPPAQPRNKAAALPVTPYHRSMPYEVFEHTADLGLRVRAPDLPNLLAEAGKGLAEVIGGPAAEREPLEKISLRIDGSDPAYLLFDWLNELLYIFESKRLLPTRFDVRIGESGAEADALAVRIDPANEPLGHEVKAITYHQLRAEQRPDGQWEASVILDI